MLSPTVDPSSEAVESGECDYHRTGILLSAKTEIDGTEVLCSGTLTLSKDPDGCWGPIIRWTQDTHHPIPGSKNDDLCGSLPDRGWAIVNESSKLLRPIRPISVELCEVKSFRLSEDSNQLTLIQSDGTQHPPMIFLDEGPEPLIEAMKKYVAVKQSYLDEHLYQLSDARIDALDRSLSQLNLFDSNNTSGMYKIMADLRRDPYAFTISAFSKISDKLLNSPNDDDVRAQDHMSDLFLKGTHLGPSLDVTTGHRDDGEFEVVTSRPRLMENLPKVLRSEPLCQLDWELHQDVLGNFSDVDELKEKIFRGGIEQNIRSDVWRYLLGYYDFSMNHRQIDEHRKKKIDEYFQMKCQWRSFTPGQEDRFNGFRERKSQVEKDVLRTDRTHPFFSGDNNKNIATLQDILMTYVMYNFDLGYVQGMSDLLAPILYVMQNEVDAFWCFVGFMEKVSLNFDFEAGGIQHQLSLLIELLKNIDPEFYSYLDAKESGNLFFCFRWLLIWFKREFAFNEIMTLWEVLWTDLPCQNFCLIICIALMESSKRTIIENNFGFNEILKHINDMANGIDLNKTLATSEAIFLKLSNSQFLSNPARKVLGLQVVEPISIDERALTNNDRPTMSVRIQSKPVNINGTKSVSFQNSPRRVKRSSGDSSSVEVISDDDSRLDMQVGTFGPFD